MEKNIKTLKSSMQHDDFKTQWQSRLQWKEQAEKWVPDDQTFLRWAEKAQQEPASLEKNGIPLRRTRRWIPYAAAASIVIGVAIIGLTHTNQSNDGLPVAEEVTVESQSIHFVCKNGCSAQDIMSLANKAFKE